MGHILTKYGIAISTIPNVTSRIVLDTKYGKIISVRPVTNGTTVFCLLPYAKKPSPIEPKSRPQRRDDVSNTVLKPLTLALSAEQPSHHGPLQRLSGATAGPDLEPFLSHCLSFDAFDNAQVAISRVPKYAKCLLISRTVMRGYRSRDAIKLNEHHALINPTFIDARRQRPR
jgi:hypothetical protein